MVGEKKFSTFSGVFMPSTLAILGAVMYFIAPQVVGGVGLIETFIIILIAHSVTIATAFSIGAIATNINVKGGGLYYLISRSLGSEFGGSLGIQLYLAQTIASSFYAIAFARGINSIFMRFDILLLEHWVAFLALIIFGIIVFVGAHFVIKLQYFILGAIVLSIVSIFLGPTTVPLGEALLVSGGMSFWVAFAMFFPAVTGIDAGVGMSGELQNPRKSLVKGTFIAIIVTMVVYFSLAIKFATSASAEMLVSDPLIVEKIAMFSPLIILGVLFATSSSALSSMMTAPRCLEAMVKDKVLPKWMSFLGKTIGKSKEPRIAILFSLAIGASVIMMGSLELVSQIVSMFFLSVYGWINGAAFFEKVSKNPSFRPTFDSPAVVSFYGMFASYAVMYLFNPLIMLIVIIFQALIFLFLYKSKKSMKFESVWDGVFFQLLRHLLKRISSAHKSQKNWRPTILAFCANDLNKMSLAKMLHWIGSQSSVSKMFFLIKGDMKKQQEKKNEYEHSLGKYIKEQKLEIFPKVMVSNDFEETINNTMQSETLGNLPLNTVLIDYGKELKLDRLMSDMECLNKNLILLRNQKGFTSFDRVDVWWSSPKNGNLMILLAYLITHSKQWLENSSMINIYRILGKDEHIRTVRKELELVLEESRIENAELYILENEKGKFQDIIVKNSEHADLVIVGMPNLQKGESHHALLKRVDDLSNRLKVSLIVSANDKIDFKVN